MGQTVPTEKILKLEHRTVTKKIAKRVQNTPSASDPVYNELCANHFDVQT